MEAQSGPRAKGWGKGACFVSFCLWRLVHPEKPLAWERDLHAHTEALPPLKDGSFLAEIFNLLPAITNLQQHLIRVLPHPWGRTAP